MTPLLAVFVCTGNTCRSPLAMALAQQRWPGASFVSAGLQAAVGQPAANHSISVAAEWGADLATHRSRPVAGDLVERADWFIGMTRSHVAQLNAALRGRPGVRVGLLGYPNQDLSGRSTPDEEEVADPFGASLETYRTVADQVARLLAAWDDTFGPPIGSGPEGERS